MSYAELTVEDALFHIFDFPTTNIHNYVNTLQVEEVKKAFRKKVKLYHPDRAAVLGEDMEGLEFKFKLLHESYDLLLSLLKKRENLQQFKSPPGFRANRTGKAPGFGDYTRKQKMWEEAKKPGAAPKAEKRGNNKKSFFYSGALPERTLRFAEYLFYTGKIDWMTLIDALVWQYKSRPRVGDVACSMGLLDSSTVRHILRHTRINERFGEAAARFGVLNEYQLQIILAEQKRYNLPIGTYFVKHNIFDSSVLFQKIVENKVHNQKYKESTL